eukprot:CAMPEP_0198227630 /NCGR_PEP_ID=MMETSP1445-20131203/109994_1 /TAXON_ID=36898 /ORGANISM="Pyramimonas sp., Strain CCMP2087" /LENGTH=119 /DNA_ID=CAMNT_0043907757 /DNA_START=256 /DNA_END=616 /DNA_ORIENTATION=-
MEAQLRHCGKAGAHGQVQGVAPLQYILRRASPGVEAGGGGESNGLHACFLHRHGASWTRVCVAKPRSKGIKFHQQEVRADAGESAQRSSALLIGSPPGADLSASWQALIDSSADLSASW